MVKEAVEKLESKEAPEMEEESNEILSAVGKFSVHLPKGDNLSKVCFILPTCRDLFVLSVIFCMV